MSWKRARFKGKDVWVEVDGSGEPVVKSGRVAMRYSKAEGATLYGAGASRVEIPAGGAVEELPAGVSADARPATSPRGAAKGSGFGSAGSRTAKQSAMAAEAARELIASHHADTVLCYTDGSSKGNPGPTGAGAVVELPDGRRAEASRALGRGTNNVGELVAVGLALDLVDQADVPPGAAVAVFTDSSYVHGVLCRNWKAKANQELIATLRERLKARPGVKLHWIAGHVGVPGNERADQLANDGVAGRTNVRWVEAG